MNEKSEDGGASREKDGDASQGSRAPEGSAGSSPGSGGAAEAESMDDLAAAASIAPEALGRLTGLGLSEDQVREVLGIARDHLVPLLRVLTEMGECERERAKLVRHFGGEEAWRAQGAELLDWGRAHLSPEIFAALSSSAEGVKVLARLRSERREPSLITRSGPAPADGPDDEAGLRRLMADPRYWRHRDPALVARVRDGFRRIYPSQGGGGL